MTMLDAHFHVFETLSDEFLRDVSQQCSLTRMNDGELHGRGGL